MNVELNLEQLDLIMSLLDEDGMLRSRSAEHSLRVVIANARNEARKDLPEEKSQ